MYKVNVSLVALFGLLSGIYGCGGAKEVSQLVPVGLNFSSSPESGAVASAVGQIAAAAVTQTFTTGNAQVVIEEAALVVRRVKLKKSSDTDEKDFKSDALVISIKLDGSKNLAALSQVPVGTYDRIKFEIHKLESSEAAAIDLQKNPEFQRFVADGSSIFIRGTYDNDRTDTIAAKPFEFKSRLNEEQGYDLHPPLEVKTGQSSVEIHLTIDPSQWFMVLDQLQDPSDQRFSSEIERNIKASIK